MLGAAEAGLRTVWLNRNGERWQYPETADLEVADLSEVVEYLDA